MTDTLHSARFCQMDHLPEGQKPPAPRAALAIAQSKAYQAAAGAPATVRAYAADLAHFKPWCEALNFQPMPATPETVGAYLAAAGLGCAPPTLRRRVAAISRAHRIAERGDFLGYDGGAVVVGDLKQDLQAHDAPLADCRQVSFPQEPDWKARRRFGMPEPGNSGAYGASGAMGLRPGIE